MQAILGTLGSLGSSLLGGLLTKGVQTLGNVASKKIDDIGKRAMNSGEYTSKFKKQLQQNTDEIKRLKTRVDAMQPTRMEEES